MKKHIARIDIYELDEGGLMAGITKVSDGNLVLDSGLIPDGLVYAEKSGITLMGKAKEALKKLMGWK